jgi:hypothetical protein
VLGIDGAFVPTRPDSARERRPGRRGQRAKRAGWRGQWRDAKGFRFYLLDGERIVHLLSWHQVHNEEQLGEALKHVKEAGLIPEEQVRLCVVCDGAEWIWTRLGKLLPARGKAEKVAAENGGETPGGYEHAADRRNASHYPSRNGPVPRLALPRSGV